MRQAPVKTGKKTYESKAGPGVKDPDKVKAKKKPAAKTSESKEGK